MCATTKCLVSKLLPDFIIIIINLLFISQGIVNEGCKLERTTPHARSSWIIEL
jgi:hypothetical protein